MDSLTQTQTPVVEGEDTIQRFSRGWRFFVNGDEVRTYTPKRDCWVPPSYQVVRRKYGRKHLEAERKFVSWAFSRKCNYLKNDLENMLVAQHGQNWRNLPQEVTAPTHQRWRHKHETNEQRLKLENQIRRENEERVFWSYTGTAVRPGPSSGARVAQSGETDLPWWEQIFLRANAHQNARKKFLGLSPFSSLQVYCENRFKNSVETLLKVSRKEAKVRNAARNFKQWIDSEDLWDESMYVERIEGTPLEIFDKLQDYWETVDRRHPLRSNGQLSVVWSCIVSILDLKMSQAAVEQDIATEELEENVTFSDEREVIHDEALVAGQESIVGPESVAEEEWHVRNVFNKPYKFKTMSWQGSTPAMSHIGDGPWDVPFGVMSQAPMSLCQRFTFFKSSVRVRVQMNGTKFHRGRALLYFEPSFDLDQNDAKITSHSNYPAYPSVWLDASIGNSVTLDIPFVHSNNYFELFSQHSTRKVWQTLGRVGLIAYSQLASTNNVCPDISVTMWVSFPDAQLHGPTYQHDFPVVRNDQPVPRNVIYDKEASVGKAVFKLKIYPDNIRTFKFPPGKKRSVLEETEEERTSQMMMEGLAEGMAKAAITGLVSSSSDKPNRDQPTNPTEDPFVKQRSTVSLSHGSGLYQGERLSLFPAPPTPSPSGAIGGSSDDMSLSTLFSLPTELMRFKIGKDDPPGLKTSFVVAPTVYYGGSYNKQMNQYNLRVTQLAYTSRPFKFWQGPLTCKVMIISSVMHTCRLGFSFVPGSVQLTEPDNIQQGNLKVVDIQEQNEVSFTIPFMADRDWLRCDAFIGAHETSRLGYYATGMLYMTLINKLCCPDNVPPEIEVIVFLTAGPGFKVSVIGDLAGLRAPYVLTKEVPSIMDRTKQSPRKAQAGADNTPVETKTDASKGEGVKAKNPSKAKPSAQKKSTTQTGVSKRMEDRIAPINKGGMMTTTSSMIKEDFMNLRTVLRRMSPVFVHTEFPEGDDNVMYWTNSPCLSWNSGVVGHVAKMNYTYGLTTSRSLLTHYGGCFVFWSGPIRYSLIFSHGTGSRTWFVFHVPMVCSKQNCFSEENIKNCSNGTAFWASMLQYGTQIAVTQTSNSLEFEIPYYSPYKVLKNNYDREETPRTCTGTVYVVSFGPKIEHEVITLMHAAGDEFEFSYPRPAPYVGMPAITASTGKMTNDMDFFKADREEADEVEDWWVDKLPREVVELEDGFEPEDKEKPTQLGRMYENITYRYEKPGRESQMMTTVATAVSAASSLYTGYRLGSLATSVEGVVSHQAIPSIMDNIQSTTANVAAMTSAAANNPSVGHIVDSAASVAQAISNKATTPEAMEAASKAGYSWEAITEAVIVLGNLFNLLDPKSTVVSKIISGVTLIRCLIGTLISTLKANLYDWVKSLFPQEVAEGRQAQAATDGPTALVGCLVTACSCLFLGCLPSGKEGESLFKYWGDRLRTFNYGVLAMSNVRKLWDMICEGFDTVRDWWLGLEKPEVFAKIALMKDMEHIEHWANFLDTLDMETVCARCNWDLDYKLNVWRCRDFFDRLQSHMFNRQMTNEAHIVKDYIRKAIEVSEKVKNCKASLEFRVDPFCIAMFGASGIGKSAVVTNLGYDVCDRMEYPLYNRWCPVNNAEQFMTENYDNQTCIYMDDFGTISGQIGEAQFAQFMNLKSNCAFPLNMAFKKGKYFTSHFIYQTTNIPYPNPNCIAHLPALLRRRDLLIECEKVPGIAMNPNNNNHLKFRFCDPEKPETMPSAWMTYEQLLDAVTTRAINHHTNQARLVDFALARAGYPVPGEFQQREQQLIHMQQVNNYLPVVDNMVRRQAMAGVDDEEEFHEAEEAPDFWGCFPVFMDHKELRFLTCPFLWAHLKGTNRVFSFDKVALREDLRLQNWMIENGIRTNGMIDERNLEAVLYRWTEEAKVACRLGYGMELWDFIMMHIRHGERRCIQYLDLTTIMNQPGIAMCHQNIWQWVELGEDGWGLREDTPEFFRKEWDCMKNAYQDARNQSFDNMLVHCTFFRPKTYRESATNGLRWIIQTPTMIYDNVHRYVAGRIAEVNERITEMRNDRKTMWEKTKDAINYAKYQCSKLLRCDFVREILNIAGMFIGIFVLSFGFTWIMGKGIHWATCESVLQEGYRCGMCGKWPQNPKPFVLESWRQLKPNEPYQPGYVMSATEESALRSLSLDKLPSRFDEKVPEAASREAHSLGTQENERLSQGKAYSAGEGVKAAKVAHRVANSLVSDPNAENLAYIQMRDYTYILKVYTPEGRALTVNSIAIGGRKLMTVAHVFSHYEAGSYLSINMTGQDIKFQLEPDALFIDKKKDVAIIDMPKSMFRLHKSRLNSFIAQKDVELVYKNPCFLAVVEPVSRNWMVLRGDCEPVLNVDYNNPDGELFLQQQGWQYNMMTKTGMCGASVIIHNTRIPGKIIGMHVCGDSQFGYANVITQEFVAQHLTNEPVLGIPSPTEAVKQAQCKIIPAGHISFLGKLPNNMCRRQPDKTSLLKTPIFDMIAPHTTEPAVLTSSDPRLDNPIYPLKRGLTKLANPPVILPLEVLDAVREDMQAEFDLLIPVRKPQLLTDEEIVFGNAGFEGIEPMDLSTSPGWPYVLSRPHGEKGKAYLFDAGWSKEVRDRYEQRYTLARRGERCQSVWMDCLKDEKRPIEKIKAGKTRIFCIPPVDYTMLCRKYTLDWSAAMKNSRHQISCQVGIDTMSLEWNALFNRLRSFSDKFIAGDFECYDGLLCGQLVVMANDMIKDWMKKNGCEQSEEDRSVHDVLTDEFIFTQSSADGELYLTYQGNPSGHPLTATKNSVVNRGYMCAAFIALAMVHRPDLANSTAFRKYVKMIAYGDDNLLAIHDEVVAWFNQITISAWFADHGINYTTADKKDCVDPYIPIEECSFLKNKWGKSEDIPHIYVPLMSKNTIYELTNWMHDQPDQIDQLKVNLEDSLRFAYFHGREFYDDLRNKMLQALRRVGIVMDLPTYTFYRMWFMEKIKA